MNSRTRDSITGYEAWCAVARRLVACATAALLSLPATSAGVEPDIRHIDNPPTPAAQSAVQQPSAGRRDAVAPNLSLASLERDVQELKNGLALVATLQGNALSLLTDVGAALAAMTIVVAGYGWYSSHTQFEKDKKRLLLEVEQRIGSLFEKEQTRLELALSALEKTQAVVRTLAGEVASTFAQTHFRTDEWPTELLPPAVERLHKAALKVRSMMSGAAFSNAEIESVLEPWVKVMLNALVRDIYCTVHQDVAPNVRTAAIERLQAARARGLGEVSEEVSNLRAEEQRLQEMAGRYNPRHKMEIPSTFADARARLVELQAQLLTEDKEVGAQMAPIIAAWLSRLADANGLGDLSDHDAWYRLRYYS